MTNEDLGKRIRLQIAGENYCSAGRQKKLSGGWLCTMICYSVDKNGRCPGFAPIKEVWR